MMNESVCIDIGNKQASNDDSTPMVLPISKPASEWIAFLNMTFARTTRGVRLTQKEHLGPLYIQKPFYPEGLDTAHAYILHPPGGLVSGDQLKINITVDSNAHALVTTPGAGRMYRARVDETPQVQSVVLDIADGAVAEWLPLEAILFSKANAVANNKVNLVGSAKVIFWDVLCLGLPANKETFSQGRFNQNLTIYKDKRLVLQERLIIDDSNRELLTASIGFQSYPVQGLFAAGPFEDDTETLVERMREASAQCNALMGITQVGEFIVVRSLGDCSERVRKGLERMWSFIRPELIGRPACPPRIWNT